MSDRAHFIAGLAVIVGGLALALGWTGLAGGCVAVLLVAALASGGRP